MIRLYINEDRIDLNEIATVGYTKQVNDLKDLASKQTNFTKSFKVPRSAGNISFFKGLGITGSTSQLPYQKNTARLFLGNTCIIFSGLAIPLQTNDDSYEIACYDGNIDFFKLLDNVKFEDINLSELSHTKDVTEIKSNWDIGNEFYSYLLADFNGKTHFLSGGTTYISADYLIPSVSIKYLWERIFQTFGFTFSGSVFLEAEFNDTFLTYPKGVVSGGLGEVAFELNFPEQTMYDQNIAIPLFRNDIFQQSTFEFLHGEVIDNAYNSNIKSWKCTEAGYYNIYVIGKLVSEVNVSASRLHWGKNLQYTSPSNIQADDLTPFSRNLNNEAYSHTQYLNIGDTLAPFYLKTRGTSYINIKYNFTFEISKVAQTSIDQIKFFKGLSPKDFYKEVMWRFGLTPFPSKDKNHIEFLTWEERINAPVQDWSGRFNKSISEKYVYEGYAKNNYFRFKYNGEGDDFNDGVIKIENENLEDRVIVINSKTYSVERLPVEFGINEILRAVPKLELWEKELKEEDGVTTIEYKPRDSRFTFLQSEVINTPANIGSQQLGQFAVTTKVLIAGNFNYSWQDKIEKRYRSIRNLFKNTLIITAEFTLNDAEFNAFDLKPIIYVKQLGGNFLVNKITKPNLESKITQAELIKINK